MIVCGIETSCDETAIALWSDEGLLGEALYSQIKQHRPYGGVVPEIAARDHLRILPECWQEVCRQTGVSIQDIDSFAYTAGPGLVGCLLTGQSFAQGLSIASGKSLQAIHHLEGHLMSVVIGEPDWHDTLKQLPPFLGCLFSGGHCMILAVSEWGKYEVIGSTCDDAIGEAFDKVAKMMGLAYPGGPELAKLAVSGQVVYDLPRPMIHSGDAMMSFSGLKTACRQVWLKSSKSDQVKADLAASFQAACVDVCVRKIKYAVDKTGIDRAVISGGVSANRLLRQSLSELSSQYGYNMVYPSLKYCTDNGAMIALAGWWRHKSGNMLSISDVRSRWPLASLGI